MKIYIDSEKKEVIIYQALLDLDIYTIQSVCNSIDPTAKWSIVTNTTVQYYTYPFLQTGDHVYYSSVSIDDLVNNNSKEN